MKEIITGGCLLAIAALCFSALAGAASDTEKLEGRDLAVRRFTVFVFAFLGIAAGFSGCGIFIRGVVR